MAKKKNKAQKEGKRKQKKKNSKKSPKTKKERFYEFFKIKKKGKEKIVKAKGVEEEPIKKENQIEHENKLLRNLFLGIFVIVAVILIAWFVVYSINTFEYHDIKFKVVKNGQLTLYNTKIPVMYQGKKADYNFYLRNDPRKLEKQVDFQGELVLKKNMVLNATSNFNCQGDGIIATANLIQLYEILGTKVIKDQNATCDPEAKYIYVNIQEANSTFIEQTGDACYNINVNNCEILPALERFMVETFVEVGKYV